MTRALFTLAYLAVAFVDEPNAIVPDEDTVVTATAGKRTAAVTIHAKEWATSAVAGGDASTAWAYGDKVTVIQWMRITSAGAAVFVPRSAYGDLLDVSTVRVELLRDGGIVLIRGGDGAGSYEARIEFDNARVRRRRVLALEAGQPTEETTYMRPVVRDVP